MKVITYKEKNYSIPTSWDEVKLEQQIELTRFSARDETFRNLHLISTMTGIDIEEVKVMNINVLKDILHCLSFLSKTPELKKITEFEFNGEKYGILDSIIEGQTQDFFSIEGLLKKYKDNQAEALPYVIAVIAKKDGETLDKYDVIKRGEQFKNLPYPIAYSIWFFFVQTERTLPKDMESYLTLQNQTMEATLNYSEVMLKQSVGQGWYRKLVKAILLLYIRFIRKSWKNFLITRQ